MMTRYEQLSAKDRSALHRLCEALAIPLFPANAHADVEKDLTDPQGFFNPGCMKFANGLAFVKSVYISELLHEIGHALFLGSKLWQKLEDGMAHFGDARWNGDEEGPVMALQIMLADCLVDYGGSRKCLKQMEEFGYGFGDSDGNMGLSFNSSQWYERCMNKQYITARKLKVYKSLKTEQYFS